MTSAPSARIGRTIAESSPSFTPHPRPPAGAPNVVLIVLDDLGFGQLGAFGGDIATPSIDRLAAEGLRYRRFHVTSLCSPTRASLLTGRNHHAVGMGFLSDVPIGFPGYDGKIPRSAATLPRILRDTGYSTFAVGKWHLTPRWEHSASGPFERWPLGLGFERYYGFLAGDTNQWTPALVSDNGTVDPPRTPEEGYHLSADLADRAIHFVQDQQNATPDKPFFLYFAPGATHAPHHAPPEWIERYRGAFDDGWEAWRERAFARQVAEGIVPEGTTLTPRPAWVDDWDSLTDERRRVSARFMEAFAGFLSYTDAQIGRVIDHLETIGVLDNTVVLLLSDNGASAEGGPQGLLNELRFLSNAHDEGTAAIDGIDDIGGFRAYNHYPWGWAWAGNAPFHLWKRYSWLGGVRTPLIVRWPGHVSDPGAIRDGFVHVVDVLPTLLDAIGIDAPGVVDGVTQQRIDGASFAASFADPSFGDTRSTQYFEMMGSRSIYRDGWKATTDHISTALRVEDVIPGSRRFDEDRWALYDLRADFAETNDLAEQEPERLRALVDTWWAEAGRNNVLPIEDDLLPRLGALEPSPWGPRWRSVLRPGAGPLAEELLPPLVFGGRIEAEIVVDDEPGDGIIAALGDWSGGWALYVVGGHVSYSLSIHGSPLRIDSDVVLGAGGHSIVVQFAPTFPGGTITLTIDDVAVGNATYAKDLPLRWQIGSHGVLVGRDHGFPVDDRYTTPFLFTGTIDHVTITAPALAPQDLAEREIETALHHE
jgi:arylsulfatase